MKRKGVVIIIVIIVIILLAISAWIIYKKYFKTVAADGGGGGDQNPPPPPNYGGLTYSGSGSGGYSPASFPVRKGMNGPTVINIQTAINKKCNKRLVVDGLFGPDTEKALNSCYGATIVSQALYTQMGFDTGTGSGGTTPSPVSSSGYSSGAFVYLKGSVADVYSYPSFEANYILGSLEKSAFLDKTIGMYVSPASNGFVKIKLVAYKPYGSSSYKSEIKDAYILASNIQKTPY